MLLVFSITGHGFGHATRNLAVIEAILAARPDCRIVIRSSVPISFLSRSAHPGVDIQAAETDTGVVQIDSLRLDDVETARRAEAFYRTFPARVAREAEVLCALGASAVVGDIPPLAFAAAEAAGLPSVALANFTWDWIYSAYPSFATLAPGVIDVMQHAYGKATVALRLPFAGGFAPMAAVTRDVPLIARRSRLGRAAARAALDLPSHRPVVLGSFGGHKTSVPYEEIAKRSDVTLVITERESEFAPSLQSPSNLHRFTSEELTKQHVHYEDLVAAADVVVTKPGYGIVSECIANGAALLYTSRGHFAENDVMVAAMSRVLRCRYIDQDRLRVGDWQADLDALLGQPPPPDGMAANGAEIVGREILRIAGHDFPE